MNGSAPALPPDLFELSVFDNRRDCGIAVGESQHLFAVFQVVLSVEVFEVDTLFGIKLSSLRAVRTSGFRVYRDLQISSSINFVNG
jgi:hypothetical protein